VRQWVCEPRCVGVARGLLVRHLHDWGLGRLAETATLVLSELFTNAVRHAVGAEDRMVETRYERLPGEAVRIEVHDGDNREPRLGAPAPDMARGRGLPLVHELTGGRWGVSHRPGGGKCVWAECVGDA
jgi:anti-sigma regulatory factor (Ser/Thr protein kinase)